MQVLKRISLTEINAVLQLALPLAIAHVAMVGMEVIDTIVAGRYSATDLAGLAMGGNIWLIIVLFMVGILGAVLPRLARFYGAEDTTNVRHEFQQGVVFALLLGFSMSLLGWFVPDLLPLLGAGSEETAIAQGYSRIIAWSYPAIGVFIVVINLLESHSLTRFIGISSLVVLPLNLLLDYLFVFGFGPLEGMGGVGCALTSACLYFLWTLALLIYALRHRKLRHYELLQHFKGIDFVRIRKIALLGLPIGLMLLGEEGYFNVSALLIAPLGITSIGAHQITIQMAALVLMVGLCIGQATAIRASQSIGRKEFSKVSQQLLAGLVLLLSVSLSSGVLVAYWHQQVPALFVGDSAVIALSALLLSFAPLYFFFDSLQVWMVQTLRGFQDTRVPMFVQLTSYWGLGFPLGYSLALTDIWGQQYGVIGIWSGFMCSVIFSSLILSRRLWRMVSQRRWQTSLSGH